MLTFVECYHLSFTDLDWKREKNKIKHGFRIIIKYLLAGRKIFKYKNKQKRSNLLILSEKKQFFEGKVSFLRAKN